MRRGLVIGLLAALCAAPAAFAQTPPTRITIVSVFDPITYGENAYVNGQLIGPDDTADESGQLVTLQESPFPFTAWTDVAQQATDYAGYYSFKRQTGVTTHYRTVWNGQVISEREVQVSVAPRIKLVAQPSGRTAVRFSGTFAPGLPGQSVAIQRRDKDGAWTTIATAHLHGGTKFQGRLRAHKPVQLRAFFATDGAHLDGFSNAVTASPGRARASGARAATCDAPRPRITRVSFKPSPPVAGKGDTVRVHVSLPGGKVYAIDVRFGEGAARQHFTLAPSGRAPFVTFALRYRWRTAGFYRLRVQAFGVTDGCKRASAVLRPRVRVVSANA